MAFLQGLNVSPELGKRRASGCGRLNELGTQNTSKMLEWRSIDYMVMLFLDAEAPSA